MFLTLNVSPYVSPHKRIWDPLGPGAMLAMASCNPLTQH